MAADAERDRAHEHRDQPVARRRQARSRRRWRTARRARTATAGAPGCHCRAGSAARRAGRIAIPNAKPSVTSWSTKCHQTKSSSPAATALKASTAGQREPVVEARLEVERVAHDARHARVGDHARGEHRVGRREQRADQEALRPAEVGQRSAWPARRSRTSAASPRRACAAAAATPSAASRPRPRARRGTGSRSARRSPGRARSPSVGSISSTPKPPSPSRKPASDEDRGQRQERAVGEPRRERADHQQAAEDQRRDVEARGGERRSRAIRWHTEEALERRADHRAGKSPAWQDADGACSGYLVEGGGQTVLLDCGPGVFAKLRRASTTRRSTRSSSPTCTPTTSSISSRTRPALRYGPRDGAPPQPAADRAARARSRRSRACASATGMTADHIELAFDVHDLRPGRQRSRSAGSPCASSPSRTTSRPTPSSSPTAARGSRSRADCGPNQELCDFAAGTDLLLIEATLPEPEPTATAGT